MSKIVILGTSHPFRGGLASYNERLAKESIELDKDWLRDKKVECRFINY